jgi:hypothetical protein
VRAVLLRADEAHRRRLLDVDFGGARETAMRAALAARVERPAAERLDALTLADRHWLVAHVLLHDEPAILEIADSCETCGELLALRFDLAAAVIDAAPAMRRGIIRRRGVRLPTSRDLQRAGTPAELFALCAPSYDGDANELEQLLSDADPLGAIVLKAECFACGAPVSADVDLEARWLSAERQIAYNVLEDVHVLARRYHWSEHEILSLSTSRRAQYIAMCDAEREQEAEVAIDG